MFIDKISAGYVGNYLIHSKEKKETYYIIQCLVYSQSEDEKFKGVNRANLVRVFVPVETYQQITQMSVGSNIDLEMSFSLETGKVYYKVV